MKLLSASLAAIVALTCLCLSGGAEASGRAGPSTQSFAAPVWHRGAAVVGARYAWQSGSSLVAEIAERYVGALKFTGLPGAWCADAVSAWLRASGKPPLVNRMAASALNYGPRGNGSPGDLAVFIGRRGAYHVGVVVADLGSEVEIVSGNWDHRVARAVVSRRGLIFVRT